jgi:Copper binding proteins, plastocyanin/azurin family.
MFNPTLLRLRLVLLAALPFLSLFARPLVADTTTIPVAASLVRPVAPFFSDVRVFNTSYTTPVTVTAVYRCFVGCASPVPPQVFTLGARESKAFDDISNQLFGAPTSLGAVEFSTPGSGGLVVTSRLYSPLAPPATSGSVGMFIPGLPSSSAKVVTALTELMNGDFRTNIGVYNPNAVGVTATIRLFDGPVLLGTVSVPLDPQTGAQVSDIYAKVNFGSFKTTNGYCTVESSVPTAPLFTYAAEADNTTQDTIFVVGAEDVAAPLGFNPPTATLTPPSSGSTPTPTPPAPTPTPTPTQPSSSVRIVNVGLGGATRFTDTVSGNNTTTIHVGDTVQWNFMDASSKHSATSGVCAVVDPYYGDTSCTPDGNFETGQQTAGATRSVRFTVAGSFKYYCSVHGGMMTGLVGVSP